MSFARNGFSWIMVMITAEQVRGARAMLRWSKRELAAAAQISTATVLRVERNTGRLRGLVETGEKIEEALKKEGVKFIEDGVIYKAPDKL
jgi:transcriptional regulator with XRE-family HTH domain